MKNFLLIITLIFSSYFGFSQSSPDAEYWITYEYTPKKGMTSKFEQAIAEKTKLYNNTQEMSAYTAKLTSGADAENGRYERIMPRKSIDWFLMDNSAQNKFWMDNVDKYVQNGEGPYIWVRVKDLSLNFDKPEPQRYMRSLTRVMKNGNQEHFWRYLKRYNQVLAKVRPEIRQGVFYLDSGGNSNTVRIITTYNDIRLPEGASQGESVQETYDEIFGDGSWENDYQLYNESLLEWSRGNYNAAFMPALSTQ